ncbi:EAL domain-containing protein [Clostridium sp. AM58-1XD]|uniref:two-component system response regulator n=1 Tax=Clostridium sp. AM58-1XD TaxID=2292307 RepID=UPI000E4F3733|nr:EAL domain-containing protein [Clostridium sp. AM58-1XD]RGY96852.1 EAL domain-containing protein [Clostridium sp. AM58-1XD]
MTQQTMLLVDDTELNLAILEGIFEENFKILKARNGKEALKLLKENAIDIVVLDVIMPVMDGFETLERIKEDEALSDIPVVMSTSEAGENEARALSLGADDFIMKPYNPVVVYKRVENIIVKHVLEQQKLRDALIESKEDFQSLADSVPGGISVWKVTDKVMVHYFNDGLCELIGCTRDEFTRLYAEDLSRIVYHDDYEMVMEALQGKAELGHRVNMMHRIVCQNGDIRWVKLTAVLYKMEEEAPIYRAVDIDVTESRENELLVEQKNIELRHTLEHDSLTDIYNRYGFCSRTAQFLNEHQGGSYVLMQVDIERFKIINELYGTKMGDRILCLLAESLKECLEDQAVYGRLEADHFVICLKNDQEYLAYVRSFLQKKMEKLSIRHQISLYFGIYPITDASMSVDLMCDRANLSLESVKGKYNQNYAVFDEKLHEKVLLEQELTNEMDWALKTGQFNVYIQPIFSIETGQIVSGEALVRWIHPHKGMISPGDFIPFFEKNGFIVKLDAYIREAVVKILDRIPISVNISRLEFYDPDFVSNLIALVEKYQVDPGLLRLEITESAYTDNPQQLLEEIEVLRKYGFKILMDDFGSGYSSLNMLKEAPVDIMKLDMTFLRGGDCYGREKRILESIIHMAKDIGLETVAEGIETGEQAGFLKNISCEYGQGYYFARPMPAKDFLEMTGTKKDIAKA